MGLQVAAVSFVSLLLELAFIRYVNSTVQVIAYFNNFVVVAAFLGLGTGSLLPRRQRLLEAFPLVLSLAVAVMAYLERFGATYDFTEDVFGIPVRASSLPVSLIVALVFAATVAVFVPLGNRLGHLLEASPDRLRAYGWDLGGSAAGVAAFAALSALATPPWIWFTVAGAGLLLSWSEGRGRRLVAAAGLALAAVLSLLPGSGTWSPYYKVELAPLSDGRERLGFAVLVDKVRIQDALHFSPALAASHLAGWMDYYRVPYILTRPRSVLVLGGGSGNDAATALAFGAERVDVVEIDPVILSLGFDLHPHRPYRDPRVRAINDDARAFLRRGQGTYDLVVMNALDSHRQLPGLSTLRLESYVYTVEAFRDVRRLMGPDSTLVVQLTTSRPWMGDRLYWSLAEAFGAEPRLFWTPGGHAPVVSVAFVEALHGRLDVAPPVEELPASDLAGFRASRPSAILATDDWPHLYLAGRRVPRIYIGVLAAGVVVASLIVFGLGRPVGLAPSLHFLLLGAGFMLLQTRSITKMALLFGSTWVVNAVVIGFILVCVGAANALVLTSRAPGPRLSAACLFLCLVAGYLVPVSPLLALPLPARVVAAGVWVALPVLFASILFSRSFARAEHPAGAFGANLLGVVIGGVLEYASMVVGLNALYVVALVAYLGAVAAGEAWRPRPA
ncbi:MAG TPA: hypothetical protein VFM88_22950 [Vicinamibacteria bacterium]|nr:hypothetical protein [Vicinamibacteria bacterium]